jgi:D-sedoheptulose 7-phosphate isomerase
MFSKEFLDEVIDSIRFIDLSELEKIVDILISVRKNNGRLFIIGSGGGAGNASHAVCDFRKICGIEAYAPYDNISELTAWTNDKGFNTSIVNWLIESHLKKEDCIMVLSVGGGQDGVSENITLALCYAAERMIKIIGITGKDGGITKKLSDACIVIQVKEKNYMTPITEGLQAVIWHLLVTHNKLKLFQTTW